MSPTATPAVVSQSAGEPLHDVDADVGAAVALGEDAAVAVGGSRATRADQLGELGVAPVDVVEPRLEERHAGVARDGGGDGRPDAGERAVGADDQVVLGAGAVGEAQLARTVGARDLGEPMAPLDGAGFK